MNKKLKVVYQRSKIQILKQITTFSVLTYPSKWLFISVQRYKF